VIVANPLRSRRRWSLQRIAGLSLGATILIGSHVWAAQTIETQGEVSDLERPLAFAIPAENLADALDRFSRTSNLQVLYDSRLAVGQHSTAVNGTLPISAALEILLQGTGLLIRYTRHHDVVLTSIGGDGSIDATTPANGEAMLSLRPLYVYPPAEAASTAAGTIPYRLYGGVVRSRIEEVLQRNGATNRGNYRVKLAIWVSPSGTLLRHALLQSSGDAARDRNISSALHNLDFNQSPPADLPQPIDIGISVNAP